jgi:hypothetical protein
MPRTSQTANPLGKSKKRWTKDVIRLAVPRNRPFEKKVVPSLPLNTRAAEERSLTTIPMLEESNPRYPTTVCLARREAVTGVPLIWR